MSTSTPASWERDKKKAYFQNTKWSSNNLRCDCVAYLEYKPEQTQNQIFKPDSNL